MKLFKLTEIDFLVIIHNIHEGCACEFMSKTLHRKKFNDDAIVAKWSSVIIRTLKRNGEEQLK